MSDDVVVVGAGLAGWRLADAVTQHAPSRRVIVLGSEEHPPYDRPPLSKQALAGTRAYGDLALPRTGTGAVDLRLGETVVAAAEGRVLLATGESLEAGDIVWATGVEPLRPSWVPQVPEVHLLRTLDDSRQLATQLLAGRSLVVIGGGFIGCEIAATARARGLEVTIVERSDQLLPGAVHRDVAGLLEARHRDHDVRVRTGETVSAIDRTSAGVVVRTVRESYPADLVVVGVGSRVLDTPLGDLPRAGGGIACSATGQVEGRPGVWAVGDVAAWFDPVLGAHRRREHWTGATAQASIAALAIAGLEVPEALLSQPPYAWSDQYDVKVQVLGWPEAADRSEWLERDGGTGALGFFVGADLCGVMTVGAPRLLVKYRSALADFAASRWRRTETSAT